MTEQAVYAAIVSREDDFTEDYAPTPGAGEATLSINIDGWEGPLDLLLMLARKQKVDLRAISILDLVEHYLAYINGAQDLQLELAADYLVMAAWLAYLKSALLLPNDPEVEPSPEELALRLQLRLERLAAMRDAAARLMARDRLGRDVFARGAPEGLRVVRDRQWDCSYFDLLSAYADVQRRGQPAVHIVKSRLVMTLEEAIARVSMLLGQTIDWTDIRAFLPAAALPELRKSALASSFLAMLELARQGRLALRQEQCFAPLEVKAAARG
jgi:segregation and condensation protein A